MTPIVLLHGVGLNRSMWGGVTTRLERDGFGPVIALDLPGHGEQPPLIAPTTLTELAADVRERMPAEPVHLVGFSLGALIAQAIAVDTPTRVRSLVCVSAVCERTEAEAAAVQHRLDTAAVDFAASVEASIARWYPVQDADAAESAGTPDALAAARAQAREMLHANNFDSYLHAYRVFATADRELAPMLGRITVPTLAITGELDPGSTPDMTRRLAQRIPGARAEIVPNVRHMLPIEREDAFVNALELHLRSVEGTQQ